MKKIETLKELTIEEAIQLLKDNNWRVENCLFSSTPLDNFELNPPIEGTLAGFHDGKFTDREHRTPWNYCWLNQTKTHWEIGETVKLINNQHTTLPVGSVGKVLHQLNKCNLVNVEFPREPGHFSTQTIESEDLEPFDVYQQLQEKLGLDQTTIIQVARDMSLRRLPRKILANHRITFNDMKAIAEELGITYPDYSSY